MSISFVVKYGNGSTASFTKWQDAQALVQYLLSPQGGYSEVWISTVVYGKF